MRLVRDIIACVLCSLFVAYCALGALYGCGETYFDSQGKQHTYDCPLPVVTHTTK